jgi:polygalacturonase
MKNNILFLFLIGNISTAFSQNVYSITEFGAKGDDATINTIAIQQAIDKCAAEGGGQVYIPRGIFLSGTITLKSNITLYLSEAATLKGIAATAPFSRNAFIYAEGQEHIAVTGPGKIYGQGEAKVFADDPATGVNTIKGRPMAISFLHCSDIRLKEFTIKNSASWGIKLKECELITVDGISIFSYVVGNNDGIDMIDCNTVKLSNSTFNCGDDAICMKSESKTGVKNVVITNCIAKSGSNAIKMGTAGIGGFEDITISNCALSDTRLSGIAIEMVDGGNINRVTVSNITMHNVNGGLFIKLGKRNGDKPGTLKNIIVSGMIADGIGDWRPDTTASYFKRNHDTKIGMSIVGQPGYLIENILLSNIYLQFAGGGTEADGKRIMPDKPESYPEYNNFGITPAYGMNLKHIKNIQLNGICLDYAKDDGRPALFMEDIEGADISLLRAKIADSAITLIRSKDIRGLYLHDPKPFKSISPLYISFEGIAEDITIMNNGVQKTSSLYNVKEIADTKAIQIINPAK